MARRTTDYDRWDKMNFDDSSDDEKQHPNIDKEFMRRILREKREQEIEEQEQEKERLREEGTPEALEKLKQLEIRSIVTKDSVTVTNDRTILAKPSDDEDVLPPPGTPGLLEGAEQTEESLEQAENAFVEFKAKHENIMKKYSQLTMAESEEYIVENPVMLQDTALQFLLLHLLELQAAGKESKTKRASRQYLMLRNIIDLGNQANQDPRSAVKPFFAKMGNKALADRLHVEAEEFAGRVKERAIQKRKEEEAEKTEEGRALSREERLGAGGLDPVEVLESLNEELQEAFLQQDKEMLIDALSKLPPDEADEIIERCAKSGLWNPGPPEESDEDNGPPAS